MENIPMCEKGELKIALNWEDTQIIIPLNFENMNEAILYKIVRGMEKRINNLQEELDLFKDEQNQFIKYKFDKMSDEKAKIKIVSYLRKLKKEVSETTLFEISQKLKISADQVEKIIVKLEEKEKVKWVEQ